MVKLSRNKEKKLRSSRFKHLSGILVLVIIAKVVLSVGYLLLDHSSDGDSVKPASSWAGNIQDISKRTSCNDNDSKVNEEKLFSTSEQHSITDLVAELRKREEQLRRKEQELRQKEEYLTQLERETEQKLKKLIAIQEEIKAFERQREKEKSTKLKSLVRIYESMKPRNAAKLLENLDENLVVEIISHMKTDLAANILSNMQPDKAVKISKALTKP